MLQPRKLAAMSVLKREFWPSDRYPSIVARLLATAAYGEKIPMLRYWAAALKPHSGFGPTTREEPVPMVGAIAAELPTRDTCQTPHLWD